MSPISKYGVIAEFPAEDREAVRQELVAKSGGVCQLCEDPIDVESNDVIIEHKDNKGKTEISNLYIAHRSCNSLKRNLPYSEAKLMIKFKKF
jgi:5-methylcytosine-specific restriction endonuclease McrA